MGDTKSKIISYIFQRKGVIPIKLQLFGSRQWLRTGAKISVRSDNPNTSSNIHQQISNRLKLSDKYY